MKKRITLGASNKEFIVWAPLHEELFVLLLGKGLFPMQKEKEGFFYAYIAEAEEGDLYYYQFAHGDKRADPVSRFLPQGVFGPTQIINPDRYQWKDQKWKSPPFDEYIFYEVHVGVFSSEGTYSGVQKKLRYLKELGVNCIQLMPLAQFPGRCNWGYDGVSLYAPYAGYGTLQQLKELIDCCHQEGIAVSLDVVYSHFGPSGNFLHEFAPYFRTEAPGKWGDTFNYDQPYVRQMVISNALYWIKEYHIDCLRLDAIHGIYDGNTPHILIELSEAIKKLGEELGREISLIAESDESDSLIVRSPEEGGYGMRALWNEEFHHCLHTLTTDEREGYYQDFFGGRDLAKILVTGFVYDKKYSLFRGKEHGSSCQGISWDHFVVFAQNHDQVGNRALGERSATLLSDACIRILPFFVLLTPAIPLLFMGEEYGEKSPFCYFIDFEEEKLREAVIRGREEELRNKEMMIPSYESFLHCKLTWEKNKELYGLYRSLITLRRKNLPKRSVIGEEEEKPFFDEEKSLLAWSYESREGKKIGVICYWGEETLRDYPMPFKGEILLRSSEEVEWNLLPPYSALVCARAFS